MVKKKFVIILLSLLIYSFVFSQKKENLLNNSDNVTPVRAVAEIGFLSVLSHKVQFSNSGTYFDYKKQGGQDVLFPIKRFSVEVDFNIRNTIIFLYQPLRLTSQVLLEDDLIVDELRKRIEVVDNRKNALTKLADTVLDLNLTATWDDSLR